MLGRGIGELRQAWPEQAVVGAGPEGRDLDAALGEAVAMGPGEALDEPVQAQSADGGHS